MLCVYVCVCIHTHTGISYSAIEKNTICSNMYAPRDYHIVLSDVRQRQISYHLCVKSKVYKIDLFTKQTDSQI